MGRQGVARASDQRYDLARKLLQLVVAQAQRAKGAEIANLWGNVLQEVETAHASPVDSLSCTSQLAKPTQKRQPTSSSDQNNPASPDPANAIRPAKKQASPGKQNQVSPTMDPAWIQLHQRQLQEDPLDATWSTPWVVHATWFLTLQLGHSDPT